MASMHTMPLPRLACLPREPNDGRATVSTNPCRSTQHSEAEWAALYPHIQRLYIHQRRKLRYVIRHMEEKYNFWASPQVYKNRLAAWGLYKNTRRARTVPTASQPDDRVVQSSIPLTPEPARLDMVNLMFLTSIRTWSSTFFETVSQSHNTSKDSNTQMSLLIPYTERTGIYDAEKTSFSFKLIGDLLERGQGLLAGRLARKAFLQIEGILLLEGPLFIWNLLEIMYSVVQLKQARLFEMLLIHLLRLARSHYSNKHSIVQMLDSLLRFWKNCPDGIMQQLQACLEQGWLLNANIVLGNLDKRFMLLYYRLIWDSVLVKLARDKLRDADTWFSLMIREVPVEVMEEGASYIYPVVEVANDAASSPPANYEIIKTESIDALRERTLWVFTEPSSRFRVLSALIKSRMLDSKEEKQDKLNSEGTKRIDSGSENATIHAQGKVPRLHARILAYVMKVLIEIDMDNEVNNVVAIRRLNSTIALRGYAQGATDPQVMYEMLLLHQLLIREGRFEEAATFKHEVQMRLEKYLQDVS